MTCCGSSLTSCGGDGRTVGGGGSASVGWLTGFGHAGGSVGRDASVGAGVAGGGGASVGSVRTVRTSGAAGGGVNATIAATTDTCGGAGAGADAASNSSGSPKKGSVIVQLDGSRETPTAATRPATNAAIKIAPPRLPIRWRVVPIDRLPSA